MFKMSRKRFGIRFIIVAFVMVSILITGYSCSSSDDYITRTEARRLIEEALRTQKPGWGSK